MAEKLCLQWNDFKENVSSAFGRLRDDKEFADVTLACEDGQQMEAHRIILAASGPFFERILEKNKHPHPLIYLKGFQSRDMASILDFLYFGEVSVWQENLDSLLTIAEELKLKGLTGQMSKRDVEEKHDKSKPVDKIKEPLVKSTTFNTAVHNYSEPTTTAIAKVSSGVAISNKFEGDLQSLEEELSRALAIRSQFSGDLEALDERVKSMMERSGNFVPIKEQAKGRPRQETAFLCKVCGKESKVTNIIDHIESNHIEGIALPCNFCKQIYSSRKSLRLHKSRYHM